MKNSLEKKASLVIFISKDIPIPRESRLLDQAGLTGQPDCRPNIVPGALAYTP